MFISLVTTKGKVFPAILRAYVTSMKNPSHCCSETLAAIGGRVRRSTELILLAEVSGIVVGENWMVFLHSGVDCLQVVARKSRIPCLVVAVQRVAAEGTSVPAEVTAT
jgi:hypothetical protein